MLIKVTFISSVVSSNKAKNIEYFVESNNWSEAIEKAKAQFKIDNEFCYQYKYSAASNVVVL